MNGLVLKTKSNQVEGRVVTVAVNAFGNIDSQNDISVKGSFTKTLGENFKRIKHFLNHDYNKLIGCPLEGKEEGGYLIMKSELAETQLASDVLQFYKLYQKNGLTLEHSIGVEAMQRDQLDPRKVLQWRMWEFSTLYNWGANPNTPLLDIKQHDLNKMPKETLQFVKSALDLDFSDSILVKYDDLRKLIEKALDGKSAMIQCDCGNAFDYYEQQEHRIDKELKNEIAELLGRPNKKRKSIVDELVYVTCPHCGKKHYQKEIITLTENIIQPIVQPSIDTTQIIAPKGLTFAAIGTMLK